MRPAIAIAGVIFSGLAGWSPAYSQFQMPAPKPAQVSGSSPGLSTSAPALGMTAATGAIVAAAKDGAYEIRSDASWFDTGITAKAGDTLKISAGGEVSYAGTKGARLAATPKGVARGFRDLLKTYPVNDAGRGALIGRWGDSAAARAFLVGNEWTGQAPIDGKLYLGLNQSGPESAEGSYAVRIERVASASTAALAVDLPDFPQELIEQIPPRVQDAQGTLGDRTNFVLIGTRERVQAALAAAGWVTVDKDKTSAVIGGLLATLSKRSYVTLPMSELMLFGRTQDFGYAQGDPVRVVAERHHFRLWEAPFHLGDLTVWAGAGTHDIGFDKDQRNGGLTHKIDPEVDQEREYIGESLKSTGMVVKSIYLTKSDAIRQAKTAHGEEFFSDGRTLILYLKP
jgi:hypothetical protein